MIKERRVMAYEERYYCDDCKIPVRPTGMVHLTQPLKYPAICPECEQQYSLPHSYPRIVYKEWTLMACIREVIQRWRGGQ